MFAHTVGNHVAHIRIPMASIFNRTTLHPYTWRDNIMNTSDRLKHAAAIALIGDGIVGAVHPTHSAQFWKKGPAGWRSGMRWCQRHPNATRIFAIAQAAAALMWVLQEERGVRNLFG